MEFKINDCVKRVSHDYTNGRIGYVVAKLENNRYQIKWILDSDGSAINSQNPDNGLKTKVNAKFLIPAIDPSKLES